VCVEVRGVGGTGARRVCCCVWLVEGPRGLECEGSRVVGGGYANSSCYTTSSPRYILWWKLAPVVRVMSKRVYRGIRVTPGLHSGGCERLFTFPHIFCWLEYYVP